MPPSKPGQQKIQRLTDEVAKLQSARIVITQRLDRDIELTREKAELAAQEFFKLDKPPQMGGGMWQCPDSPNGYCWYRDEDRACDECIVCGDPLERK